MYLHKEDLKKILEFMENFDRDVVFVESDTSSGIGAVVTAKLERVKVKDMEVTITNVVSDETSW